MKKADARFERAAVARICKAGRTARNWTANAWLLERKLPDRYGRVDRHLIHATAPKPMLPQEYIDAINTALGMRGEFKPLIKGELPESTNGDGEMDILP